ncbi:MAG TPA: response regulator [Acidimicrobiia bacterium]|nr:response regulator [Acidimicrobiia bacterium]
MARILVVDDQPDALLAARAALVAAGHECILAADGERALELLAGGGVDLMVIEPAMPLHDGWPVVVAAGGAKIPVIAVSAAGAVGGVGVVTWLAKPARPDDLAAAVEAALAG